MLGEFFSSFNSPTLVAECDLFRAQLGLLVTTSTPLTTTITTTTTQGVANATSPSHSTEEPSHPASNTTAMPISQSVAIPDFIDDAMAPSWLLEAFAELGGLQGPAEWSSVVRGLCKLDQSLGFPSGKVCSDTKYFTLRFTNLSTSG
jgi:hypothetical protein